jgi:hypothetical protein
MKVFTINKKTPTFIKPVQIMCAGVFTIASICFTQNSASAQPGAYVSKTAVASQPTGTYHTGNPGQLLVSGKIDTTASVSGLTPNGKYIMGANGFLEWGIFVNSTFVKRGSFFDAVSGGVLNSVFVTASSTGVITTPSGGLAISGNQLFTSSIAASYVTRGRATFNMYNANSQGLPIGNSFTPTGGNFVNTAQTSFTIAL